MGGEPGVPESVATGAPAEAQEERVEHDDPALNLEHRHNTFDNSGASSAPGGSGVGTAPEARQNQFQDGDNVAPAIEYERELNPQGSVIGDQTNPQASEVPIPDPRR